MKKEQILKNIENYIAIIMTSPELFHDRIDEEILDLLLQIKKYIEGEK